MMTMRLLKLFVVLCFATRIRCHSTFERRGIEVKEQAPEEIDQIVPEHSADFCFEYLGNYSNKLIYLDNTTWATQAEARANCTKVGMKLLDLYSQAEMNFVSNLTKSSQNQCWTDGVIVNKQSSYKWQSSGDTLADDLDLTTFSRMA